MEVIDTVVTVAVVAGIVEVVKKTGVNRKYLPLIALVTGVIVGLVASVVSQNLFLEGVWNGIIAGLMASGSYDVVKKTID